VLIECLAQLILNTLTPAIDQLPKRTDDGYECKSWATAYIEFHPNSTHVLMIVDISLYADFYSAYSEISTKLNSCVTANLA